MCAWIVYCSKGFSEQNLPVNAHFFLVRCLPIHSPTHHHPQPFNLLMWALDIQNEGISLCMNKRSLERSHGGCITITYNTLKEKYRKRWWKWEFSTPQRRALGLIDHSWLFVINFETILGHKKYSAKKFNPFALLFQLFILNLF